MGVAFPGHPARAQSREGNNERTSSSLHGCIGTTNRVPFTAVVLHFPLPTKFRMPQIKTFKGTKDPVDHLNTNKNQMELQGY